jgi:hypothetical protein
MNRPLKGPDDMYTRGYRTAAGALLNSNGESLRTTERVYKQADYAIDTEFGKGVLDALTDWKAL